MQMIKLRRKKNGVFFSFSIAISTVQPVFRIQNYQFLIQIQIQSLKLEMRIFGSGTFLEQELVKKSCKILKI